MSLQRSRSLPTSVTSLRIIKMFSNGLGYRASVFCYTLPMMLNLLFPRLASTVFHQFVAADNASETFAGLKRIHGLMPYFMLRTALKVSNPIGMIRSTRNCHLSPLFVLNFVFDCRCPRSVSRTTIWWT